MLIVVAAVPLFAQQQAPEQTAQKTAEQPDAVPSLVEDTTINPDDSPLVRAAKRTLAKRRTSQTKPAFKVNDNTLVKGRVSYASGPAHGPTAPSRLPAADAPAPAQPDRAAEAAKRVQELQQEQARMRDEADEGPYGEVEEDQVEHRLSTIPNEIQTTQTNPPPPR
jgi:hypothetical protein